MAEKQYDAEACLRLLQEKQAQLTEMGEERYPRRADFSELEVEAVKAHLGPWPRALERAGIKPAREDNRQERVLQKRIEAKRRRNEARRAQAREKK